MSDRVAKLLKLLNDNAAKPKTFEVKNADGEEATVYLYDAIGSWWGVPAEQFVKDLNAITAPTIHLRINSPGGDVFEGRAIEAAIKAHKSKVVAHIDGLAASAATYVAIAADEVEISAGGFFMIHNAWMLTMGNATELRDAADLLEKIDATIAADYVAKTGKMADEVRAWMDAETWFSADEALANGFVDRIAEAAAKTGNGWNLSAYANAPKSLTQSAPDKSEADDVAARASLKRAALERRLSLVERGA